MKQSEFLTNLYKEHLAELSFFYTQRQYLLSQQKTDLSWIDLKKIEGRIEPHIDALYIGGEKALEVCQKQSIEGDFGELYASCCIFCRQKRLDLIYDAIEKTDSDDREKIIAITSALNFELPELWQDEVKSMLSSRNQIIASIAAEVCGYRRIRAEKELIKYLSQHQKNNPDPIFIRALGRMPDRKHFTSEIQSILIPLIKHENEIIRYESSLSLLRSGIDCMCDFFETDRCCTDLPLIPATLSNNVQCIKFIVDLAEQGISSPEHLIALGLIGNMKAINILLEYLSDKDLAETAAISLNLVTGADLFEEIFIPETIDEDLLFDDELERLKKGEALYPPGEEPGTKEMSLSKNIEDWKYWLKEKKDHFLSEKNYRLGKPYDSVCVFETIQSPNSINVFRQLAYEELVIRFGIDIPFETDMFVKQQNIAIKQLQSSIT